MMIKVCPHAHSQMKAKNKVLDQPGKKALATNLTRDQCLLGTMQMIAKRHAQNMVTKTLRQPDSKVGVQWETNLWHPLRKRYVY